MIVVAWAVQFFAGFFFWRVCNLSPVEDAKDAQGLQHGVFEGPVVPRSGVWDGIMAVDDLLRSS